MPSILRPEIWIDAIDDVFFKQWSTVKSRELDSTYIDICDLMPYTVMELVCRYVEHEMDHVDWTWCDEVRADSEVIMDAYHFWYDEYLPFREDRHPVERQLYETLDKIRLPKDQIWTHDSCPEYNEALRKWGDFEINIEQKLDEHLAKLMSVRQRLWT